MDEKHLVSYGKYILVWFALLVLTGATVTAAGLAFGGWGALAAIIIATIKGALVLFYFMHLRYEGWLFRIMVVLSLGTVAVTMILTFADTLFR